jgi:ketosteroid isomerase-like protein
LPTNKAEIVRAIWAGLEIEPGLELESMDPEELDRRLMIEIFEEDVEIRNVEQSATASGYRGHAGVRKWAIEVWEVFSEVRHEVLEVAEAPDGESVVTVQLTSGRMRHSGLEVEYRWAGVWKFSEGKVRSAHGYSSRTMAFAQAGIPDGGAG